MQHLPDSDLRFSGIPTLGNHFEDYSKGQKTPRALERALCHETWKNGTQSLAGKIKVSVSEWFKIRARSVVGSGTWLTVELGLGQRFWWWARSVVG
jgi:hypothetical protein